MRHAVSKNSRVIAATVHRVATAAAEQPLPPVPVLRAALEPTGGAAMKQRRTSVAIAFVAVTLLAGGMCAATFTVDTTVVDDVLDVNPGDGICEDASGHCSLTAAVGEANALAGADVVVLPAGSYLVGPNASVVVSSDLTLEGAGVSLTLLSREGVSSTTMLLQIDQGARATVADLAIVETPVDNSGVITNRGRLALRRVRIESCAANQGAVFNTGLLAAEATEFVDNQTDSAGGAVQNSSGTAVFSRCRFQGNSALDGPGGALAGIHGTTELVDCLFSFNSTGDPGSTGESRGGAVSMAESVLPVRRCTFAWNHASGSPGGALAILGGSATLQNVTFASNSSDEYGGALAADLGAHAILVESTFVGNLGLHSVAGALYTSGYGTSVSVGNSIFANQDDACLDDVVTSLGHNIADENSCGFNDPTDRISSPLSFLSLGDYGGEVWTLPPAPGNPAIDGGDCAAGPGHDARGAARPSGSACDVGAVEVGAGGEIVMDDGFESGTTLRWTAVGGAL